MKFGLVLPNHVGIVDPHEIVSVGVQAEELGFDSVWVNHHVINAGYVLDRLGDRPYHDALILLSWVASKTSRVRVGTSVLVLPYLHPMVLARELASLDHLARGRLVVGVGVGSLPDENRALGVPYASRGAYANEFLEVLRRLWTQPTASFHGAFFDFDDVVSSPKPFQSPTPAIVVGGNKRAALRRVARFADGWHPLRLPPQGVRDRLETLRAEAERVGRADVQFEVQVRVELEEIDAGAVAAYADAGATELVVATRGDRIDEIRTEIDRFASAMLG